MILFFFFVFVFFLLFICLGRAAWTTMDCNVPEKEMSKSEGVSDVFLQRLLDIAGTKGS